MSARNPGDEKALIALEVGFRAAIFFLAASKVSL